MPGRLALALLLLGLAACAKPDLPDTPVRAASAGELTSFRSELGERFAADRLQDFDTALQELKLAAMSRGVATAAAREQEMLAAIQGKTVRQAEVLGWQARRTRLLGEQKLMSDLLARDQQVRDRTAATGTPESVLTHIQNEQDILARLGRDLQEADARLAAWGASAPAK